MHRPLTRGGIETLRRNETKSVEIDFRIVQSVITGDNRSVSYVIKKFEKKLCYQQFNIGYR